MAFVPTILKPVHVRAYWRFRLFRWEFVHEHWRSLPNRQEEINLSPESGSNLSDKDFLFLLNSRYLTVFLLKLPLLNASGQYNHLFLLLPTHNYVIHGSQLFSDPDQSRQLQCTCHTNQDLVQAPFQVKTSNGFCSQSQIWFAARNAPVKTSKVFVHYFPSTGMQNLHHASSGILCRKQENWDGGI